MSGLDRRRKLLLVSSLRVNAVADIRTVMATSQRWLKHLPTLLEDIRDTWALTTPEYLIKNPFLFYSRILFWNFRTDFLQ